MIGGPLAAVGLDPGSHSRATAWHGIMAWHWQWHGIGNGMGQFDVREKEKLPQASKFSSRNLNLTRVDVWIGRSLQ